jgi:YYY domain-containing protein
MDQEKQTNPSEEVAEGNSSPRIATPPGGDKVQSPFASNARQVKQHAKGFTSVIMPLIWSLLLGIILLAGAYFRYTGMRWDEGHGLHPDERFMGLVLSAIQPVDNLGDYFNTDTSTLNPHNRGYTFYVYGTLPLFIVRYLGEWTGESGFGDLSLVGRYVSATLDLGTVLLVFLIALKLYKKPWLALMAAAFAAFSVLPIQLSHYNTVDTYANFFITLACYFAVSAMQEQLSHPRTPEGLEIQSAKRSGGYWLKEAWRTVTPYVFFGVAFGGAISCKISAAPVAVLLPGAAALVFLRMNKTDRRHFWPVLLRNLVIGGMVSLFIFRIFQPYAFSGPGFFNVGLNPKWVQNLTELSLQSAGDVDFPPALQWARRSITFAWENMVIWGLGLPLGLMAWGGFLLMGWRMLKGEFQKHALLWIWTGAYFAWQSINFTRSMRYQLPIYPTLAIIAAWGIFALWERRAQTRNWLERLWHKIQRSVAVVLGLGVLVGTFLWAYAFLQIYIRPVTRLEASYWLYQNVPGAINLRVETPEGVSNRLVNYGDTYTIRPGEPYLTNFTVNEDAALTAVLISDAVYQYAEEAPDVVRVGVRFIDLENGNQEIGFGMFLVSANENNAEYTVPLDALVPLLAGHHYGMQLEILDTAGQVYFSSAPSLKLNRDFEIKKTAVAEQELLPNGAVAIPFRAEKNGTLRQIRLPLTFDDQPGTRTYTLTIQDADGNVRGVSGFSYDPSLAVSGVPAVNFDPAVIVEAGREYTLIVQTVLTEQRSWLNGEVEFSQYGDSFAYLLSNPTFLIREGKPYEANFVPSETGLVTKISFAHVAQEDFGVPGPHNLLIKIYDTANMNETLAEARLSADLRPLQGSPYGDEFDVNLAEPLNIQSGKMYKIVLSLEGEGAIAIRGSAPAHESSWDDGLPMRVAGYDAYGGVYQRDLNFEMYWDDNTEKVQRFINVLNNSDYIFITSNRQWGTTIRVPERYPLTTAYYKALIGCPDGQSIFWCYAEAVPGMFEGQLGFELIKVFQSEPSLASLRFNSQFAEEAFSVYDHPKVMIFRKKANFDINPAAEILRAVDLSNVIRLTPLQATNYKGNLMLPAERLAQVTKEGTWSELYDRNAPQNTSDVLAVVLWYLTISLLGWLVYPFVRLALGRLADHGYPFTRLVGMLLLTLITWWAGSLGVAFSAGHIALFIGVLAVANGILFWLQRRSILTEIRARWKYFLVVEGLMLAFFLLFLFVRLNNPDLWHPYKGGEKPMDFSYFNAVLKSTTFPPYDPWFAGGYINYYYYGFVLVGVPVKLLGIIPATAYNLILPTLFSFLCMGFFSVVWNLVSAWGTRKRPPVQAGQAIGNGVEISAEIVDTMGSRQGDALVDPKPRGPVFPNAGEIDRRVLKMSVLAAVMAVIFGNLGITGMVWLGLQRLSVSQEQVNTGNFFERIGWTFEGIGKLLNGAQLPYPPGEWYWGPSRVIPDNTINEFPAFTFLYADLHAHMVALPMTLLAVSWALSILRGRWKWGATSSDEEDALFSAETPRSPPKALKVLHLACSFLLAGVTIGALQPTNTWDLPTYFALGALTVLYTVLSYAEIPPSWLPGLGLFLKRLLVALVSIAVLVGTMVLLYQPFNRWYAQGYGSVKAWDGPHTPLWSYITHWGLFLLILGFWMVWEIRDWMDKTPLSRLNKLRPYRGLLIGAAITLFLGWVILIAAFDLQIFIFAVPFGLMATTLLFRPGQPDSKRIILFMTGTGLLLTILVEVIVLEGDIGRMNTVFKFYLQTWTLFAISSGAALYWLQPDIRDKFATGWRRAWKAFFYFFLFSAALFPLVAGIDKMTDRISPNAPKSLDGMAYMNGAMYADFDQDMDLSQDYRAIRWMQDNVQGSPVIVEANTVEYHWGSRFTTNTGLPGVVGWNWHQRQQRGVVSGEWVTQRVDQIRQFYTTQSKQDAIDFLQRYGVKYIILGQLERGAYKGSGLDKFEQWNGDLWDAVYRDADTVIYEVKP